MLATPPRAFLSAAAAVPAAVVSASGVPSPSVEAVLTISDAADKGDADREARFDMRGLEAPPAGSAGAQGQTLRAVALDDYAVEGGPIVARKMNGQPTSAPERAPLRISYPHDDKSQRRREQYYSGGVWRLASIDVR